MGIVCGSNVIKAYRTAVAVPTGYADPTLLLAATAQAADLTAYAVFNVPNQAAGYSYLDPVSGIRVTKITSSVYPVANSWATHDYSEFGPFQSGAWGSLLDQHTIQIRNSTGTPYLIDFRRGGTLSNSRALTGNFAPVLDVALCFSNDPATPQIMYVVNSGGTLRKINTATMTEVVSGFFPKTGFSDAGYPNLSVDKSDIQFSGMRSSGSIAVAWRSTDDRYITETPPGLNEPHMERDGQYVALIDNNQHVYSWDTNTDTVVDLGVNYNNNYFQHNASPRGFWFAADSTAGVPGFFNYINPYNGNTRTQTAGLGGFNHHSGNFVNDSLLPGSSLLKQWIAGSRYEPPGSPPGGWANHALGFVRLDGSDSRLICHSYNAGTYPATLSYGELPFAQPSPDGRIVVFNSNMEVTGVRSDVFVAEIPLR